VAHRLGIEAPWVRPSAPDALKLAA